MIIAFAYHTAKRKDSPKRGIPNGGFAAAFFTVKDGMLYQDNDPINPKSIF